MNSLSYGNYLEKTFLLLTIFLLFFFIKSSEEKYGDRLNQIKLGEKLAKYPLAGIATIFCGLFGLFIILNTLLDGDGNWYWYSQLYLSGKRLYTDLHLLQQPLYILFNSSIIKLFGTSWIATRISGIFGLSLFLLPIYLLAKKTNLKNWEQAILIFTAFFVGIRFEAYRFDDYHVIVDSIFMISALFLLRLKNAKTNKSQILNSVILGILCSLAFLTRINNGLALFIISNILILILAPKHRFKLVSIATFSFVVISIFLISLTGDSISDWFLYSILGGIPAKGGSCHLLLTPLLLPWNAVKSIFEGYQLTFLYQLLVFIMLPSLFITIDYTIPEYRRKKLYKIAIILIGCWLLSIFIRTNPINFSNAVFVWIAYILSILIGVRFVVSLFKPKYWDLIMLPSLLFLPTSLWISGSLSSAGFHVPLCFPLAFFLLLLPLSYPQIFKSFLLRSIFITLCATLAFVGIIYRYENPCSWGNYRGKPMFQNRIIINHSLYGPTIIDKDLYIFFNQICSTIASSEGDLLSLPFPFANYYCGISPWNNYVQTFFDISNAKIINQLITELQQKPPKWILYQQQLPYLRVYEILFNSKNPLPHRDLDIFLMEKLNNRQWSIVVDTSFTGNRWILIHTQ